MSVKGGGLRRFFTPSLRRFIVYLVSVKEDRAISTEHISSEDVVILKPSENQISFTLELCWSVKSSRLPTRTSRALCASGKHQGRI